MAKGFFINNKDCYGCKTCSVACTTTNIPGNRETFKRRVRDILIDDPKAYSFLPMSCNHCESPVCLAVCPVGAYKKLEDGIVQQNHAICIGCQTCVRSCPYGAPVYDKTEGKTYKCDMCIDRQRRGQQPACVEACPGENLSIGEMEELKAMDGADYVSDPDQANVPNFVIHADPKLKGNPAKHGLAQK
jgi:Fe-S-cluster-containing dehydrogenase component